MSGAERRFVKERISAVPQALPPPARHRPAKANSEVRHVPHHRLRGRTVRIGLTSSASSNYRNGISYHILVNSRCTAIILKTSS